MGVTPERRPRQCRRPPTALPRVGAAPTDDLFNQQQKNIQNSFQDNLIL